MNTKLSRRHFNRERIADPSTWVPSLELTYDKANDGSATVINRYDFPIQEDRVRFVMPTGASYAVSGAEWFRRLMGIMCISWTCVSRPVRTAAPKSPSDPERRPA